MRAIVVEELGGPEVLVERTFPDPVPEPSEVAIAVEAAGVNFGDMAQRSGTHPMPLKLPVVLGVEVAGAVSAVGDAVREFSIGDRVAAMLFSPTGAMSWGGYASVAVADERRVVRVPDGVDPACALGVCGQGLAAWFLVTQAADAQGRAVLVHAAAGGVGSLAVQLAHEVGAGQVLGTAGSEAKRALVAELGAEAVDYGQDDWPIAVRDLTGGRGVDVVLDPIGGDMTARSVAALAPYGKVVWFGSMSGSPPLLGAEAWRAIQLGNLVVQGFTNRDNVADPARAREVIEKLLDLNVARRLKVSVTRFPLGDAAEAHRALAERRTQGKVVLVP